MPLTWLRPACRSKLRGETTTFLLLGICRLGEQSRRNAPKARSQQFNQVPSCHSTGQSHRSQKSKCSCGLTGKGKWSTAESGFRRQSCSLFCTLVCQSGAGSAGESDALIWRLPPVWHHHGATNGPATRNAWQVCSDGVCRSCWLRGNDGKSTHWSKRKSALTAKARSPGEIFPLLGTWSALTFPSLYRRIWAHSVVARRLFSQLNGASCA